MRDWILVLTTVTTLFLSILAGFVVGVEFQRSQKAEIQTHVVSVLLHNPPEQKKKKSPVPPLFKNQEHKMEVKAITESEELYCMAQNIYFEAGNQIREGKVAVAQVVMNRVRDKHYPNTVCGVVYQRMQFSWYWDGKHDTPNKKSKAWKDSVEVATEVMYGNVVMKDDLSGALHYHADYVKPYWAKKKVMIAKIDDHIFYGR